MQTVLKTAGDSESTFHFQCYVCLAGERKKTVFTLSVYVCAGYTGKMVEMAAVYAKKVGVKCIKYINWFDKKKSI